jgi:putative (di)nucleoside polyphosphate hydrolase
VTTCAENLYRPGVGIALFNKDGMVFLGERIDHPGAWQMPQGGIDEGEEPEIAVFREMEEEIGTRKAQILGVLGDWVYYDLPDHLAKKLWNGAYRGQRQKWIALAFLGDDSDIRLDAHSHPEFSRWQWVSLQDLVSHAVSYKRDVYARVVSEFAVYAAAARQAARHA